MKALLACCGSRNWAIAMAAAWPFPDLQSLLTTGERLWLALGPDDWLEALAAHPRIGDRVAAGSQEAREQSAAVTAAPEVLDRIAAGNAAYEERFGYVYVVRASGRSAEEMLALLENRLANDPAAELAVAAAQQWEIAALRLAALWSAP